MYLKNLITKSWDESEPEPGTPVPFNIHEQDRSMIRNIIVEAIIQAPELIKSIARYFRHSQPIGKILTRSTLFLQNATDGMRTHDHKTRFSG